MNRVNLDIADGEFLVLVGPSGSGKSTALRMLAGLEEVNEGRILIGGRDVTNLPPKNRDIAMVFQSYALYPHMSVADNMGFALKLRGVAKDEIAKKVKEAAGLLDLVQYLDRKPKALSGGQRQRVAMGRAIVREPSVFLMDEPLSNLDAKLRVETRANIAELQARLGTTTVYVTHDQVEAMTMGHRVAVLQAGGFLQQVDTPRNLYDRPANVFVAGFMGSPSMNLCKARLVEGGVQFGSEVVPLKPEVLERGQGREPDRGHLRCPSRGRRAVVRGHAGHRGPRRGAGRGRVRPRPHPRRRPDGRPGRCPRAAFRRLHRQGARHRPGQHPRLPPGDGRAPGCGRRPLIHPRPAAT